MTATAGRDRARDGAMPGELGAGVLGTHQPEPRRRRRRPGRRRHAGGGGGDRPARWSARGGRPRWPQAGERARGGTVVVTLEPCAHTGRTGPCADALIAAGVARVVVAVPEPTELAGGGADRLRAAGVDVELGVERAEAEAGALAGWLTGVREHRPFVIWKVAATLDGRVAAADGTSRWITGERGAGRRPPAAGHLRRRRRRVGDGAGRRPPADRPRRRRAARRRGSRCAWWSTAAAGSRPPPGCSTTPPRRTSAAPPTPAELLAELFDRGRPPRAARGRPDAGRGVPARRAWSTRPWCISHPRCLGAGPSLVGDLGIPTIAGALSLAIVDVTRLGGDVEVRLRPNRHTGGRQFADGGS